MTTPRPARTRRRLLTTTLAVALLTSGAYLADAGHSAAATSAPAALAVADTSTAPTAETGPALPASAYKGTQYPVAPYISTTYVTGLPQAVGSFIDQPSRGYLTTVPAASMLSGIGVGVRGLPASTDVSALFAKLAVAGVRSIRVGVPWSALNMAGTALSNDKKAYFDAIFRACATYGITPDVMLDANSDMPEPMPRTTATVLSSVPKHATKVHLSTVAGLRLGYSGLSGLTSDEPAAGVLLTSEDGSGVYRLSQPLPVRLRRGQTVTVNTFQWLPLYPVGSPQFAATDAAFKRYVKVVAQEVAANGVGHFWAEVWNELTFASSFLNADNYLDHPVNPTGAQGFDNFVQGAPAYQLAEDAAAELHRVSGSDVDVDWGYSNTSFSLGKPGSGSPGSIGPDFQGKSFHPYKTDDRTVRSDISHDAPTPAEQAAALPDGPLNFVTDIPEGVEATGIKPESLPRDSLFPANRAGAPDLQYLITETGYSPAASGLKDVPEAQLVQSEALLREYAFWLDKGVSVVDDFSLGGSVSRPTDAYNLLNAAGTYTAQQLATLPLATTSPPLAALQRYTSAFAGAKVLTRTTQLQASVAAVGKQYAVDPSYHGPKLMYRDLLQVLPYQVTPSRFVVPIYVMSYDVDQELPGGQMGFRVTLTGLHGSAATVSFYDPITGESLAAPVLSRTADSITVGVSATAYPRLLTVTTR